MSNIWMHKDAENWLRSERKLDPELMKKHGVRSGTSDLEYCRTLPSFGSRDASPVDWILFPNYRDGKETGVKIRHIDRKDFASKKGSQHLLYTANTEILSRIEEFDEPLIICEGELDYFSWKQAGFECVGSAPSASTRKHEDDGPPKWIEEERDRLLAARRIIIAVDCDRAGSKLKAQMIRHLDRFRLYELDFPDGCKDANDVLKALGREEGEKRLYHMVRTARPVPVSGVRRLSEIQTDADAEYSTTGWPDLDKMFRMTPGLTILTGYSGGGKSQFLRQLNAYLCTVKKWNGVAAYMEDDNKDVVEELVQFATMIEPGGGDLPLRRAEAEIAIEQRMTFIDARQARRGGEQITTDWLIDLGEAYVLESNIRFMIVDTWSRVKRSTKTSISEVEQINEELQRWQDFGQAFGVVVIICAHPTKPKGDPAFPPTEYDIAGARSFNDNADSVLIVHRPTKDFMSNYVRNAKVRNQRRGGSLGWMEFTFNEKTRLFEAGQKLPKEPDWKLLASQNGERR